MAAGQLVVTPATDADDIFAAVSRIAHEAHLQRAQLLVLPECAYPSYAIGSLEQFRRRAIPPSDAFLQFVTTLARREELHIATGFVEPRGQDLFNAAVVIAPDGRECGRHRKTFLWHKDREWFLPGERLDVVETALGRIGILICAEARIPEAFATLTAQGAELIVLPTCWIDSGGVRHAYHNPQIEFFMAARAKEFGRPIVAANKAGHESDLFGYCGRSLIQRRDGTRAVEAAGTGEAVISADVSLADGRTVRVSPSRRHRLLDGSAPPSVPAADATNVTVAVVPGKLADGQLGDTTGTRFFKALAERGVTIAVTNVQYDTAAERVTSAGRSFGIETACFPTRSGVFEFGRAVGIERLHAGYVGGQAIRSFASARSLALDGAAMLFVHDAPDDQALLRTRAAENRVFILAVSDNCGLIIAPDGEVLAETTTASGTAAILTLDPAEAAEKAVAPQTNLWEQRRVSTFRF